MLAKELQLSVATISKALRDSHEISSTTKLRVKAMAEKLNYVPNHYASSLGRRNSKTIGVVIPEVVDSFFAQAINGIESVAEEKGYHVLIYLTHESLAREKQILKDFESGMVDGVLMSVSKETTSCSHIEVLIKKAIPVVFFDRACDDVDTSSVTTNDFESACSATEQLISNGCQQILFLSFSNTLSISNKRLEGYKAALQNNGLKVAAKNILLFNNDGEKDYRLLQKRIATQHPDGIIASVEKLAVPVYRACEAAGLSIPEDVQLISFSNLETAAFLNPPLTTITQPAFEMGKTAAMVLIRALGKKKAVPAVEKMVIASELVVRKSTR